MMAAGGGAIEGLASPLGGGLPAYADLLEPLALGGEPLHGVYAVVDRQDRVVGGDGEAVGAVGEEALPEGPEEPPLAVEDDDGVLAAGEDVDVVLGVDGDAGALAEAPVVGKLRPVLHVLEPEIAGTVGLSHRRPLSPRPGRYSTKSQIREHFGDALKVVGAKLTRHSEHFLFSGDFKTAQQVAQLRGGAEEGDEPQQGLDGLPGAARLLGVWVGHGELEGEVLLHGVDGGADGAHLGEEAHVDGKVAEAKIAVPHPSGPRRRGRPT